VRIAFLGTPPVAVPTLETLLRSEHRVVLVVTQPDRAAGRSAAPIAPAVKSAALHAGVAVIQPQKVRSGELELALREAAPEALVVVAFGRLLPGRVLDVAPRGAINVHFSLLPELRGAAPVQWALAEGHERTGVSTMRMNEELDAGDILLQRELAIAPAEHAPALAARLALVGAELLAETLERLGAGTVVPRPQDAAAATHAPMLTKRDGEVDPSRLEAREIEGRVRGFDPWPGVWLQGPAGRLRIVEARAGPPSGVAPAPGEVVAHGPAGVSLACRGGSLLHLLRVQVEGRRAVAAADAMRGRLIVPGHVLAPVPP